MWMGLHFLVGIYQKDEQKPFNLMVVDKETNEWLNYLELKP